MLLSRRSLCLVNGVRLIVKLGKCQPGRVLILKVRNSYINPESKLPCSGRLSKLVSKVSLY